MSIQQFLRWLRMASTILGGFGWIALQAAAQSTPATMQEPARVLAITGTVEHSLAGSADWSPARAGQVLQVGDSLRTHGNSRATIRLADQTVLPIDQLSAFTLKPPARPAGPAIFQLLRGIAYIFSRDRPADVLFETPTASGATRGTEFVLAVADDGSTTVTVLEGAVDLQSPQGILVLNSGEQGRAESERAPTKSPVLDAVNVIQWTLYYPMVLDPKDLGWPDAAPESWRQSLNHYLEGDVLGALAAAPAAGAGENPATAVYRAALLLAAGRVEEARAALGPAQAIPGSREARQAAALHQLIAAVQFQTFTRAALPSTATEWMAESYYQQARADLDIALAAARQAVAARPEFGAAWIRLAELQFSFGRVAEATRALETGLDLTTKHAQGHALRGFLWSAENRIARAIESFDRAIALDPGLGSAWLGRGLCRIRQGDAEAGREDLLVAAAREPLRALPRSYLAKSFADSHRLGAAAQEIEHARRLDPADPTAWLYSALIHQRGNRINEAVRDLKRSMELNDNRRVFRSRWLLDQDRAVRSANLAGIYKDAGFETISLNEAYRAVNLDYANYAAHLFLADSYNALRDPKQINLRYETPWFSEYLVASLLAPPAGGALSPAISQHEYSRLLERSRLGVVSTTEYLSNGDWFQSGSQYGIFGNMSYAINAAYRSERGYRPNNDLESTTLSFQVNQQLNRTDNLFLQAIYYDFESGDVFQYYDQGSASPGLRVRENQEPILIAGWHRQWDPHNHTLLLFSRMDDTLSFGSPGQTALLLGKDAAGQVDSARGAQLDLAYASQAEIYAAELQHIWQRTDHALIAGLRYQTGEFDTAMTQTRPSALGFLFARPPADLRIAPDLERLSAYGYYHWQIHEAVRVVGGIAYDDLKHPRNHRDAPVSDGERHTAQVSPKAGVIITPGPRTTLRGAYSRALGGVSFDQSFQLEPTQVAGFNQTFRSLIPESVTGAATAPTFENGGISLEQRFRRTTYVTVGADWLASDLDRFPGVFDLPALNPPFLASATPQQLNFEELAGTVSIHQLAGDSLSFSARYRIADARLSSRFVEIPAAVASAARRLEEATLHQVTLGANLHLPGGWFAQTRCLWTAQSNRGYATALPGDDFWQFHVFAGYRFAARRAEIRVGVLNFGDQDYQLNPLTLYAELPRERTFIASVKLHF